MDVLITIDVELWLDNWQLTQPNLTKAISHYINGHTPYGDYGLSYKLDLLSSHNLKAVFFVESLFAQEFGLEPLRDIIEPILAAKQEVQLHAHPAWAAHSRKPLIKQASSDDFFDYSFAEQSLLIETALDNLQQAGASSVNAFRAGNYSINRDTLRALAKCGIPIDSSYNYCAGDEHRSAFDQQALIQPTHVNGIAEYPVSFFQDAPNHHRHTQLCACSFAELRHVLLQAYKENWQCVNIVSHSFELMCRKKRLHDRIVTRRFNQLCQFLSEHRDKFQTIGFNDQPFIAVEPQPEPIHSNVLRTGMRIMSQALRRLKNEL